ncbi:restriction endonuclease subunit S [Calditerricola satsumensis]|nr:restriction endonuclease subunit S [Calditerricola satsumensis]
MGQTISVRRHKKYQEYKDSGVGWLGQIPAHWELRRLRHLALINPSPTVARTLSTLSPSLDVSFIPMDAVGEWGGLNLELTKPLEDALVSGYTYFCNGDVLVAKITPCFENGKGALAVDLVNGIGFGSTELHVIRPGSQLHPAFLTYLTFSKPFRVLGQLEMKGAAGQQRVPEDFIKDFVVPLPPLSEQQAIAAFLDRETAKIDALVAKKERLIELLQEKRNALISQAVTKGLDLNVPMKDSGVDWLGEVPAHWDIVPLFTVARERNVPNIGCQEMNVLSLSYGRIVRRDISENFGLLPESFETYQIVDTGNIVLRLTDLQNDKRSLRVGLVQERGIITSAYVTLEVITRVSPKFLFFLLHAYDVSKVFYNMGAGVRQTLKYDDLKRLPVLIPSQEEQQAIAAFLDRETAKIDALISKIREGIERLKEYRTALISAAVTGKIDVRHEVDPSCYD